MLNFQTLDFRTRCQQEGIFYTCGVCNTPYTPTHPAARYCTLRCRTKAKRLRKKQGPARPDACPPDLNPNDRVNLNDKSCLVCKRRFHTYYLTTQYCSERCRHKASNKRRAEKDKRRTEREKRTPRPMLPRGPVNLPWN